ncbi:MAG: hypothetical protein GX295_02525 [Syntrophomonadaceae bacterium]|nr:hypothetical protein [Syntrophomonadaceae bacterium]
MKELEFLLGTEAFKALGNSNTIKIYQLFAVISLLIKCGIPFDLTFDPSTRRDEANAELTIYINPNTSIVFTFNFEG